MSQTTEPQLTSALRAHVAPSLHDRRKDNRKSVLTKAIVKVIDGARAGSVYEVMTRDMSMAGVSFLLREPLAIGQTCTIEMAGAGGHGQTSRTCEVVRSRAVSNGRFEMAIQYR